MAPEKIIRLFGYSDLSPEIGQLFRELGVPPGQPEMSVSWRHYTPAALDMELVFRARHNFRGDYGPHQQAYSTSYEEGFLEEVNFGSQKGLKTYPHPLPFGLRLGDKPDMVKKEMPAKGSKPVDASYGSYLAFHTEDLEVITGFDRQEELIWVGVKLLQLDFKKIRELKKNLKKQDANISAAHAEKLGALQGQLPCTRWTQRMKDGDDQFTPDNIAATTAALHHFTDTLLTAMQQKKASAIYTAVKKLVRTLNKLNEKYGFIDTLEREELAEYIHQAVRLTGFVLEEGADLTEEWREW